MPANPWPRQEPDKDFPQKTGGPPDTRTGSSANGMKVYIVGADQSFVDMIAKAMGGGGGSIGNDITSQLKATLTDQAAITQATKQIATDLKVAATMVLQFQADAAKTFGTYSANMASMRKAELSHMQTLLSMMSVAMLGQVQAAQVLNQMAKTLPSPGSAVPPSPGASPPPFSGPVPSGAPGGPGGPPPYGHAGYHGHQTSWGMLRNKVASSMVGPMGGPGSVGGQFAQNVGRYGVMGAARALPVAGPIMLGAEAAWDGANKVGTWVTQQRAENAQYQSIYGGQNFSVAGAWNSLGSLFSGQSGADNSGYGNRMQEAGFVLGQRFSGGLTGDQASQAFRGVSSLGFTGDQRQKGLDFITTNYQRMGMDVSQSLQLVEMSAKNGNQSLVALSDSLDKVTKAAAATGQSAAALRQNFAGSYQTALGIGAGAGAAPLATAMTMSTAGISRDLGNVDYNRMLADPLMLARIAAQSGLTPGQLESKIANGDIRSFTQPAEKLINTTLLASAPQSVRDLLKKAVDKAGGNVTVAQSPGAQSDIANQLLANPQWNTFAMRAALDQVHIPTSGLSDSQIAQLFVTRMTGIGLDSAAQAQQDKNKITPIDLSKKAYNQSDFVNNMLGNSPENDWFDFTSKIWGGDTNTHNSDFLGDNALAYADYQTKNKASNPAIEAMLKTIGMTTGAQIRVRTKDGDRVVSVADAIKYYPDQISTGTAYVVGGPQDRKTLAEATGVTDTGFAPGQNGMPDTSTAPAAKGIGTPATADGQNGNASANGVQSNGTVTVSPSPELMALFNWSGSGNVSINNSANVALPPAISGGSH